MPVSELRSTERPSSLRLAGFVAVVVGAVLAGIGATRAWASVGLLADRRHANDVAVIGTDVWEGKAVLLLAVAALVLVLVTRIVASTSARRALAVVVLILGLACAAIAGSAALRARDRFGGTEGVDRLAAAIARQTGDAEDVVRDALLKALAGTVRVDTTANPWLAVAGGVAIAVGGGLGLAWARERERRPGLRQEGPSEPMLG
jgi:hypothetical protein